jgi:rRNA-processing protein FCF1
MRRLSQRTFVDDQAVTARPKQPTYAERLLAELDDIAASYADIHAASGIEDYDLKFRGSGLVGFARYGWESSDDQLEAARMTLLRKVRDWKPRFRLLFPHPTPNVSERLDNGYERLEVWLTRDGGGYDIPPTIAEAQDKLMNTVTDLRGLIDLLPPDDQAVRLVVDTNALIDNPDVAAYTAELGPRYVAHLLPAVLREIDELKRGGKNDIVRSGAQRAERRLKGIRTNGDVREGVRVAGDVIAKFEHIEPRSDDLPDWLDMTVPDDRIVASTLLLQSQHPGSALYVATGDINMQTKLSAVGIPFVEPPE